MTWILKRKAGHTCDRPTLVERELRMAHIEKLREHEILKPVLELISSRHGVRVSPYTSTEDLVDHEHEEVQRGLRSAPFYPDATAQDGSLWRCDECGTVWALEEQAWTMASHTVQLLANGGATR